MARRNGTHPGSIRPVDGRNGRTWQVRLTVAGRRYCFTSPSRYRADAERLGTRRYEELSRRTKRAVPDVTTVADLLRDFRENELEADRAAGTVETYAGSLAMIETYFVDVRGDPDIRDVGSRAVVRFTQWRKRHRRDGRAAEVSNRTVNKDLATLRVLFEYAVGLELLDANPVHKRHKRKEVDSAAPTIITPEEYQNLLGACADDPMLWTYVLLLGETAIRSTSEASWLRFRDVGTAYIEIGRNRRTKSGKSRRVFIDPRGPLPAALRAQRERYGRGNPHDWFFYHTITARHHRVGDRVASFYDSFKARATAAGIAVVDGRSRLRQHDLRHSRITWLLAEGAPVHVVQGLVGHASVTMTERYYDYIDEHQTQLAPYFENIRKNGTVDRIAERITDPAFGRIVPS